MNKKILVIGLYILCSFIVVNPCSAFTADATGNTYLSECMSHKQIKRLATQEVEKESKGIAPNYDALINLTGCYTAASIAFRTVTQVGYPWANVNTGCYIQYYGMEDFSIAQLSDLLLKYLQDHPEVRHLGIGSNMMEMLHDYYPVPKKCFMTAVKKENL